LIIDCVQCGSFVVQSLRVKRTIMKLLFAIFLVIASLGAAVQPVQAQGCDARARAIASEIPGGQLLSVDATTNSSGATVCVARIRVAQNGKPPRVVTRRWQP